MMKQINITRVSAKFYFYFLLLSLCGNLFLDFNTIEFVTWFLLIVYFISYSIGTLIGRSMHPIKFCKYPINVKKLLKYLLLLSLPSVLIGWIYIYRYYGSFVFIFLHAMDIRNETIGDGIQIVPTIVSYLSSFTYVGIAICLSSYHYYRDRKLIYLSIIFAILVILLDLQAFGRIGMLYTIFLLFAYIIVNRIKVPAAKTSFYGSLLFILFMLPRYLRGGGSMEGISDRYNKYLKVAMPGFMSVFLTVYCYYFSGIYAFNELLKKNIINFSNGQRNFSSLINLMSRLTGHDTSNRIVIIGDDVHVPYEINIYSILGELYLDFGEIGLFILPIFFGVSIGFFFNYKGIFADALKMVFLAWLFYTPIYNMFSFGAFFLAYIILAILVLFTNEKNINYYSKL